MKKNMMLQFLSRDSGMPRMTTEEMAEFLKATPEALEAFEEAYHLIALPDDKPERKGLADISISPDLGEILSLLDQEEASLPVPVLTPEQEAALGIVREQIIRELEARTSVWRYDASGIHLEPAPDPDLSLVDVEALKQFPLRLRPQLTGDRAQCDIPMQSGRFLLDRYHQYLTEQDPEKRRDLYGSFRQGLDLLDIDPLLYAMLGCNRTSMGGWLPGIIRQTLDLGFFRIPETTIIRVPPTLLQMSRLSWTSVNPTTRKILNDYCMRVFRLDPARDYFVKTGIFSCKFDFRNAHVTAGQEVRELGEYLLYLSNFGTQLASPLNHPAQYGVATTNEWVVREFIHDVENNPCIYKGMPLHTEYRIFVDFDRGTVLSFVPYWDEKVMKARLDQGEKYGSLVDRHDSAIYRVHEKKLYQRYNENVTTVVQEVERLAKAVQRDGTLTGQWSVDIMQNGKTFWLIDMALAQTSAFYESVPKELRAPVEELWFPTIGPQG